MSKKKRNWQIGSPEAGNHSLSKLKIWYGDGAKPDLSYLNKLYYSQDWRSSTAAERNAAIGLYFLQNRLFEKKRTKYDVIHATIFDSEKMGKPRYHWSIHVRRWVTDADWKHFKTKLKLPKSLCKAWICYHPRVQYQRRLVNLLPNQTIYSTDPYQGNFRNIEVQLRYAINSLREATADLKQEEIEKIWVYLVSPNQQLTTHPKLRIGRIVNGYFLPSSDSIKKMLKDVNEVVTVA